MEKIMQEVMEASASIKQEDLLHDLRPVIVVYKDGRVQRLISSNLTVPPSVDAVTGVESKDMVISTETGVYVRMYKPQGVKPGEKLPVLVYFHGGAFLVETAASPMYHSYLNVLCSKANVIVVSVDYRLAPEHPLPAAYDDSWAALEWVGSGLSGAGAEPWLSTYADPARVFLAGDSAGGNISHHMAKKLAKSGDIALKGVVLVHPKFWGKDRIGSELQKLNSNDAFADSMIDRLWKFAHPGSNGSDDSLINPGNDPEIGEMAGEKVLVFVAEQDILRDRGVKYKEVLEKSGWKGDVQVVETKGENHVFHLYNHGSTTAADLMDKFVAFINST